MVTCTDKMIKPNWVTVRTLLGQTVYWSNTRCSACSAETLALLYQEPVDVCPSDQVKVDPLWCRLTGNMSPPALSCPSASLPSCCWPWWPAHAVVRWQARDRKSKGSNPGSPTRQLPHRSVAFYLPVVWIGGSKDHSRIIRQTPLMCKLNILNCLCGAESLFLLSAVLWALWSRHKVVLDLQMNKSLSNIMMNSFQCATEFVVSESI